MRESFNKKITILLLFGAACLMLKAQVPTTLYEQVDKTALNRWVDSVYAGMSIDQKVGQLFMPIVEPKSSWKNRIASDVREQKVGGLLFSRGTMARSEEVTNYAQQIA